MDATPTFREHNILVLRVNTSREAWRKQSVAFTLYQFAFYIDVVLRTRALKKLLCKELVEMLINGRSIIMWALSTVVPKLIFRNGYRIATRRCTLLSGDLWRDFKYAAFIEKWFRIS